MTSKQNTVKWVFLGKVVLGDKLTESMSMLILAMLMEFMALEFQKLSMSEEANFLNLMAESNWKNFWPRKSNHEHVIVSDREDP